VDQLILETGEVAKENLGIRFAEDKNGVIGKV